MNKVYFSTVWEDYNSIREAMQISKKDVILTISSSGDNAFNFLSDDVKKVFAVDFNPAQLSIAKLKLEIIKRFSLNEANELLEGVGDKRRNKRLIKKILNSNPKIKRYLARYDFSKGINNIGQFESKAVPVLRFFIKHLFKPKDFHINNKRKISTNFWLKALIFMFSRKITYNLLLHDLPNKYINIDIYNSLTNAFNNFLKYNDHSRNFYLQKVYFGKYVLSPPFLSRNGFNRIKKNIDKISFFQGDILKYLENSEKSSINKINFSDIFDWCSEEQFNNTLNEAHRVLSKGGLVFYRELFVSREMPKGIHNKFEVLNNGVEQTLRKDNIPFYHKIVLLRKR